MINNITVGNLWDYFCENRQDLKNNYHLIASDEEQGIEIYLTNEKGFPCFSVEVDGEEVYGAETVSVIDAENTYIELLNTYLLSDYCDQTEAEEDDERVAEITRAVEAMLETLIEDDPYFVGMAPQEVDELISVIEEFLFDHCEISVRHPTYRDGVMVQYPFEDPVVSGSDDETDDLPDIKQ